MAQHDKYGRLGVMSDTHGSLQAWRQALAVFGRVDAVLHAGDVLGCGYRSREGGRPLDLADESTLEALYRSLSPTEAELPQPVHRVAPVRPGPDHHVDIRDLHPAPGVL